MNFGKIYKPKRWLLFEDFKLVNCRIILILKTYSQLTNFSLLIKKSRSDQDLSKISNKKRNYFKKSSKKKNKN